MNISIFLIRENIKRVNNNSIKIMGFLIFSNDMKKFKKTKIFEAIINPIKKFRQLIFILKIYFFLSKNILISVEPINSNVKFIMNKQNIKLSIGIINLYYILIYSIINSNERRYELKFFNKKFKNYKNN